MGVSVRSPFVILGTLAITVGSIIYNNLPPWRHPYVPPRANADGTIDYPLIFKPLKLQEGDYWVLRLDKDQWINKIIDSEETYDFSLWGTSGSLRSVPNRSLVAHFHFPEMKPYIKGTSAEQTGAISIQFSNNPSNADIYFESDLEDVKEHCETPTKINNRITEYRRKPIPNQVKSGNCFSSLSDENRQSMGYLVHDSSGNTLALYTCLWPIPGRYGHCTSYLMLPFERTANITIQYYSMITPDELVKYTDQALDFILNATVTHGRLVGDQEFSFEKFGGKK
jgi:hypothetical protein